MSGTTSPTAAYVDITGIHAPTFADVQAYLISQYQAIYGADIVVSNDSQDGQLIGVFALAISDANAACIAVYNGFSPATAQGVGLSSMVKINGMVRNLPSNSNVDLLLVGVTGTVIVNGVVQDVAGFNWNLPGSVTIPPSGQVTVTAICATAGAITAPADSVTQIQTVTRGWQSATNPAAAAPGAPVEDDAQLRVRQSFSTALPSVTVLDGIVGAILALPGVLACVPYENDTNNDYTMTPPPAGESPLPPHSISMVVQGGDATQICETILAHKTPGCYTYGTTRVTVEDIYNLPHDIGFFVPTTIQIGVAISVNVTTGYSSLVGDAISQAVADYINGLGSGVDVVWSKLWVPADLSNNPPSTLSPEAGNSYDITSLTVGTPPASAGGGAYAEANIAVPIFEIAQCNASDVVITATSGRVAKRRR